MSVTYETYPKFKLLAHGEEQQNGACYVDILTDQEFDDLGDQVDERTRRQLDDLMAAESCYADVYPGYIIGSIAIPNKDDLMGERCLFSFLWRKERLVFIDDSGVAEKTMARVANTELDESMSTGTCLYLFLRELIATDHAWIGELEDRMEDIEESMTDSSDDDSTESINAFRRISIRITNYYRQLGEMALVIAGNDYSIMKPEVADQFNNIVGYADRLVARSETIREYSLQLRELHQTHIDMQQNQTMQLLTIVTVILAPLTVIAGWFGMNFQNIPGTTESWGFPVICIVGLSLTLLLVIWFRKKKWL